MKYIEVAGLSLCDNDLVFISTYPEMMYKLDLTQIVYSYKNGELYDKYNNILNLSQYGIAPPYYVAKVSEKDKIKLSTGLCTYFDFMPKLFKNGEILGRTIRPGDVCVSLCGGKFSTIGLNYSQTMVDDEEYLVMYSKSHFLYITKNGVIEVPKSHSKYLILNYIKLSNISDNLKLNLQTYIDIVKKDINNSSNERNKLKTIDNLPGTIYQGNRANVVYLYLGKYRLDVDTSNYQNIRLGQSYLTGGDMYVEINTNRNPGKTVYEKLINGTLSASEFDDFIVKSGINLGISYDFGYNTIEDYLNSEDFTNIDNVLDLKCIKFNFTNRKFKSVIGRVHVPTSLSFNLRGKKSYKDVVYQMIPL